MLTTILALLSSSSIGSLVGWIGGLLNRKIDQAAKRDEYSYNLSMRDKDLKEIEAEVAGRIAVADRAIDEAAVVATGNIESAAYQAMEESFKEQGTRLGGKYAWVDAVSKLIRPVVTIIFVLFSLTISIFIVYKAFSSGIEFTVEDWRKLLETVVQWVFFQSGVVIGWWFANRPSAPSIKLGR